MIIIEDILKNIEDKYRNGKYIKFNVKINWELDSIPTIIYETEEMPNIIQNKVNDSVCEDLRGYCKK